MFFHVWIAKRMTILPKVTFVFCISVQEFMTFTSALIVERSTQGSRASVKEQGKKNKNKTHLELEDQCQFVFVPT